MPHRVLGISAFYHDSAAALVVDGVLVAAAQEERFTRRKHDAAFPQHAVSYCLREAGLTAAELDLVVFYEKPLLKFDRLLETWVGYAPAGFRAFLAALPGWLRTKLYLGREIRAALGGGYGKRLVYTGHHEAHAACAFFPSPFEEAAILTLDGVGEWQTASLGLGRGRTLELRQAMSFPHSLGLLYSAFTYFCGFKVNSGEYKLMGLAPFGEPRFAGVIREKLLDLRPDGSFRLAMEYFTYPHTLQMTGSRFARLFGGPARAAEAPITQREMDLAASIQAVTEEIILRMARHARALTGQRNLCLAGGVALNCVANGVLLREGIFDDLWIAPAAGDAGGAAGAAFFATHQLLERPRVVTSADGFAGALLGPRFQSEEVRAFLQKAGAPYRHCATEEELLEKVIEAIIGGQVVGWFQGRMEFGPRALGARSILADARHPEMQSRLNLSIKYRESFRPFAPAVLEEDASAFFDLDRPSPYMLLVAPVREKLRRATSPADLSTQHDPDLRQRLKVTRSSIPAVTHVDYSARIQTVDAARHGRFYRLLCEMKRQTGVGLLINTSFNVRGEPIVCTPADAYRCFRSTEMDLLVLEDCLLVKSEQPPLSTAERAGYLAHFDLD